MAPQWMPGVFRPLLHLVVEGPAYGLCWATCLAPCNNINTQAPLEKCQRCVSIYHQIYGDGAILPVAS